MRIIPGILTSNKNAFNKLVDEAEGATERIHVDFIDGEYADNTTFEPIEIEVTRYLGNFDAHLMVASHNLEDWVTEVIMSGFERVIVHVESVVGQIDMVRKIKRKDCSVGLAIDLQTPVSKISKEVYEMVDCILVMGVQAGFDGQKFDSRVLKKVKKLKEIKNKRSHEFTISVDGGVSAENINSISEAGADEVIVGKRIFYPDLQGNIDELENALK
ncbi:ribulose-phosphate 3-epimerase [Patescibacteria group bacterium]